MLVAHVIKTELEPRVFLVAEETAPETLNSCFSLWLELTDTLGVFFDRANLFVVIPVEGGHCTDASVLIL
jgi:hypothetical protein